MTGSEAWDGVALKARLKARRRTARAGGRQERPPDTHPAAGECLLGGIDAVLLALASPTQPSTPPLVDTLRAALARTAARGDTCRVPEAADSVRRAVTLLLAGSPEQARQALRRARTDLVGVPGRHR
jgi:hypothetical protein